VSRILITGAAAGLGRALAREAHTRGHDLALVDISPAVEAVARDTNATALVADLASADAATRVTSWAPEVDVLINNAGVALKGPFHELSADALRRLIDVNVVAPLLLSRAYLPRFLARGSGTIVNVSSSATYFPTPGLGPYGASKSFLTAFSETLESEAGAVRGVRILCICPAGMATDFQTAHGVKNADSGVLMDPADVARWCLDDVERGRTGVRHYGMTAHGMRILRRLLPRRLFVGLTGTLVARHR
jgi:uncharacterized protein